MKMSSHQLPFTILACLITLSGCSGLILRDNDSSSETAGKVAARVLLCPATLCISEIGIAEAKQEEQRAVEAQRYAEWFHRLSPEQQERELDRQARLDAARMQAIGMFLGSGGFKFSLPAPYQPPPVQPVPTYRPPVNFMTNVTGSQAYTSCY